MHVNVNLAYTILINCVEILFVKYEPLPKTLFAQHGLLTVRGGEVDGVCMVYIILYYFKAYTLV